jgi:AraC-like DNA-binding protein
MVIGESIKPELREDGINGMDGGFESRQLYTSDTMWIGTFRCAVGMPDFDSLGKIRERHALVFPRTSVFIQQEGHQSVLMDPNRVALYNQAQPYRRMPHSQAGDRCEYFYFDTNLVLEALGRNDPSAYDRPERPFRIPCTACEAPTYLMQRRMIEHLERIPEPDPLFIEESGMEVLRRVAANMTGVEPTHKVRREATRGDHRQLALAAQDLLNRQFQERLSLAEIAASLSVSPFHLARVFRQQTGLPLHAYLEQLRLRVGLEWIAADGRDLASIACALGFTHHSHFTLAMRKHFGHPPSLLNRARF